MTDEERRMIEEIRDIAKKAYACSKQNNDFLYRPPIEGKGPRAEQIDALLSGVRAGKLGFRVTLYLAGFVAALGGALGTLKGWWFK